MNLSTDTDSIESDIFEADKNLLSPEGSRSSVDWHAQDLEEKTSYQNVLNYRHKEELRSKLLIWKALFVGVVGSIFTTSVMILLFLHFQPATEPINLRPTVSSNATQTCGPTFETAKQNNCTYDSVANVWLPQECSRVGLEEFLADSVLGTTWGGPWRYWTNWTGENEIADISTFSGTYYTTEYEHMAHCAYMLYRMAYARTHPVRLDRKTEEWEHAKHCTLMLLAGARYSPTSDVINSYGVVSRSTC